MSDCHSTKPVLEKPAIGFARIRWLFLLCTIALCSFAANAANVSISGDLFLGVWTPMQSRWQTRVPVCINTDNNQALYRVVAFGEDAGSFAMRNGIGDELAYTVFWHTGRNFKRREALKPSTPSRKSYAASGDCRSTPTGYIRVKLDKKDIDNAIPAIYQDTLTLMVSPL